MFAVNNILINITYKYMFSNIAPEKKKPHRSNIAKQYSVYKPESFYTGQNIVLN